MTLATSPQTTRRSAARQKRSRETVELILSAAADLLEEVGFEQLSTNLICKRAKLTPPALYRYFPNKYAVLKEMGERLMARQNALLQDWTLAAEDLGLLEAQIAHLLEDTIRVTRETQAGGWIMRSLHATPILSDVRRQSHRMVSQALSEQVLANWPALDPAQVALANRLGVETGYALVEMVFDEPDLDQTELIQRAASMLGHNIRTLLNARSDAH
ncbi:MAG: TetR/AcrR family transcriptional regulator [Pseudomonadota bacterium]